MYRGQRGTVVPLVGFTDLPCIVLDQIDISEIITHDEPVSVGRDGYRLGVVLLARRGVAAVAVKRENYWLLRKNSISLLE